VKPTSVHPKLALAKYEAHHILALATGGLRRTRVEDLVLLCAGCHRTVHRAIALERRWLSVDDVKRMM
jgi:5-methylcytosine-specific restriction enzyme A